MSKSPYLAIILGNVIYGLFYVLLDFSAEWNVAANFMFASILFATLTLFVVCSIRGTVKQFVSLLKFKDIYFVSLLIVVLPFALLTVAAYHTSGLNIAIILLSELCFAYFITLILNGKSSLYQSISSLLILLGSIVVVYKPGFVFNVWDLLVFASSLSFVLGNFFSKKLIAKFDYESVLLTRFVISLPFLMVFAVFFDGSIRVVSDYRYLVAVLVSGILVMAFSKYLWYYALNKLDLLPATAASMTYPAFTLLFSYLLQNSIPSSAQLIGLVFSMLGLVFLAASNRKILAVQELTKP